MSASVYLASQSDGNYHMVEEVAGRTGLPVSYLAKIMQRLARKNILDSRRGAKGGYRLIRPAQDVTLSEIVAASYQMEASPMPCMIEAKDCDTNHPCSMHRFVASTEIALWKQLNQTTLASFSDQTPQY